MSVGSVPANASRFICVAGKVLVRTSTASNPNYPKSLTTLYDFTFLKIGWLTIPVHHYCPETPPDPGSIAFIAGELWFPAGESDRYVDATMVQVIAHPEHADHVVMGPGSVNTVGMVTKHLEHEWHLEVATYDRETQKHKNFDVVICIPATTRYQRFKSLAEGKIVPICGVLAAVSATEVAKIELESVTFISLSDGSHASHPASWQSSSSSGPLANSEAASTEVRTKRSLRLACQEIPMKKVCIGPPGMFLNKADAQALTSGNEDMVQKVEGEASGSEAVASPSKEN